MTTNQEAQAALQAFDQARDAFATTVEQTPAAALRYRPEGEDYALGGLAIHVAQVLEKYTRVLEAMHASAADPVSEPLAAAEPPTDAALIRNGFSAEERSAVLGRVRASHAALVSAMRAFPGSAFETKLRVTFVGATEPFPTSPADVLGWVHGHYEEHIAQIGELCQRWEAVRA